MAALKLVWVFVAFALLVSSVFAAPVIESFEIDFVFPDQIQLSWRITSANELFKLEIFEDNEFIYDEEISGTSYTSLYQLDNDGLTHEFKLVVLDIFNESAEVTGEKERDETAPKITSSLKILSSKEILEFTTDEPAICIAGLFKNEMFNVSTEFKTNHSIIFDFEEGENNVFVKCVDEEDNGMEFVTIEFTLDMTMPGKVSNINYTTENNMTIITWDEAEDDTGIAKYNIYNTLKLIDTTTKNSWIRTTEDGIYFITAVDEAGHEGEKAEFNLGRELLLESDMEDITGEAVKQEENKTGFFKKLFGKKEKTEEKEAEDEKEDDSGFSAAAVIGLVVAGILLGCFIGYKIYEHKTDAYGLRKYLKDRRKIREQQ